MASLQPILATEATAAKLLDLSLDDFRRLVEAGHLPRGREIAPGLVRWPVDELRRITDGRAADGMEGVKW